MTFCGTKMIKKLMMCVHRVLCVVGVHAAQEVFRFDEEGNEFLTDGYFCGVCNKIWEKKE